MREIMDDNQVYMGELKELKRAKRGSGREEGDLRRDYVNINN